MLDYLAQKQHEQLLERGRIAGQRNAAAQKNDDLARVKSQLESLLRDALEQDAYIDLESLKERSAETKFTEKRPRRRSYIPEALSRLESLSPSRRREHERAHEKAESDYKRDLAKHKQAELAHKTRVAREQARIEAHNQEIDQFILDFAAGEPEAIADYFQLALKRGAYPPDFPREAELVYAADKAELRIDLSLPALDAMPAIERFRYDQDRDEIVALPCSPERRRGLYLSTLARICLRTAHEIFTADRGELISGLALDGWARGVNPSTGQPGRFRLASLRMTRGQFEGLDLARAEPMACLRGLSARISERPDELAEVDAVAKPARSDDGGEGIERLESQIEELERARAALEEEKAALLSELEQKQAVIAKANNADKIAKSQNEKLAADLSAAEMLITKLAQELESGKQEQDSATAKLEQEQAMAVFVAADGEYVDYVEAGIPTPQISRLVRAGKLERHGLHHYKLRASRSARAEHVRELASTGAGDNDRRRIETLESQSASQIWQITELERARAALEEEKAALLSEMEQKQAVIAKAKHVAEKSDERLRQLRAALRQAEARNAELTGELESANQDQSANELEQKLATEREEKTALEERLREEQQRNSILESQLEARKLRLADLEPTVRQEQERSAELNNEVLAQRLHIANLEAKLAAPDAVDATLEDTQPVELDLDDMVEIPSSDEYDDTTLPASAQEDTEPFQPLDMADEGEPDDMPIPPRQEDKAAELLRVMAVFIEADGDYVDYIGAGLPEDMVNQLAQDYSLERHAAFRHELRASLAGKLWYEQRMEARQLERGEGAQATGTVTLGELLRGEAGRSDVTARPAGTPEDLLTDLHELVTIMGEPGSETARLIMTMAENNWECSHQMLEAAFQQDENFTFANNIIDEINDRAIDQIENSLIYEEDDRWVIEPEFRDEIAHILRHPNYLNRARID